METQRKITRCELALLGLTALFLAFLSGLYLRDREALSAPAPVETRLTAPIETVRPDPSPLDLNAAPAEKLTALPGIGKALAARIVAYREENGPFGSVDELTNVSGIGPAKLAALEGLITVEETE